MPNDATDHPEVQYIKGKMDTLSQGDCFVGDYEFIALHRLTGEKGLEDQWLTTPVAGLVVVSQSCDIVRSPVDRPYIEFSPLVQVDAEALAEIIALRRPRYAAISGIIDKGLVADLDRTMTVEKAAVANWIPTKGLNTDADVRQFSQALARKRQRFAFPDQFNRYVQPLRKRLTEKHGKASPEGDALRALTEIRVLAEPSWLSDDVRLTFYFIRNAASTTLFGEKSWADWAVDWKSRLVDYGPYKDPDAIVMDFETMSAAEYLQSDRLDLEHLSDQ